MELIKQNFPKESDLILIKIKKPNNYIIPSLSPFMRLFLYKRQKIIKTLKLGQYYFYDDKILYFV